MRPGAVAALAAQAAWRGRAGARDGVITGVVDGAHGRPLTGACVVAAGSAGTSMAMTHSDGRYVLAGLRPSRYTLHYSDCSAPGRYFDQWSGGGIWPQRAATVAVAPGQVRIVARVTLRPLTAAQPAASAQAALGAPATARINSGMHLPRMQPSALAVGAAGTGAIAGKVTGNGKPLAGICAIAFRPAGFRQAKTAKTGKYLIRGLRPGRYVVAFMTGPGCDNASNWLSQYYKGVDPYQQSPGHRPTPVKVSAGHTTRGIDAALKLGGEIAGAVRAAATGKGLAGICVFADGTLRGKNYIVSFGFFLQTGRGGRYALHSLVPAKYHIGFSRGCGNGGNYVPQWWKNSLTYAHATPIKITSGTVMSHVNVALATGASVSGVVKAGNAAGVPLAGICVFAAPEFAGPGATARTRADGSYRLVGMSTGRYAIDFSRCGNRGNYLGQTRHVRVTTGQAVTGFDAFLQPGAIVSGTVTDAHGVPVAGICVQATGRHGQGGARTHADGTYSISALPTGSYTVQFSGGCGNAGSYTPQYYNGQTNRAAADPVALIAGQTMTGINAAMQPGGAITGVVTGPVGHPLSGICVAISTIGFEIPGVVDGNIQFTNNGAFAVQNLVPGLYQVNFGCQGANPKLADQWFQAQPSAALADYVSAAPGAITSGVNAVMRPGGSISGVVRNKAGTALRGICVLAIPHGSPYPAIFPNGQGRTNRKGAYRIGALAAGTYDVQFTDCDQVRYASQWYKGTTQQSSTPVRVRTGATTIGINARMLIGGSISGLVTNPAHQPMRMACAEAYDQATQSFGFATTSRTGHYVIRALSSGSYTVAFFDCTNRPRYAGLTRPAPVTVTAPRAVTGINGQLSQPGTIAGTVLGPPSGRPQRDVCVVAVPVSPDGTYGLGVTGKGGAYQMTGLAAGQYQVYFGDPFCLFVFSQGPSLAPQWYNDQPSQSTATQVGVSAGTVTTGIDATLAPNGGISGTVTDALHAPVAGECVTAVPVNPVPDPAFGIAWHNSIAVTASDGTYSLVSLPPGQYKVRFSVGCGDTGFTDQWWHDAASAATATVVAVSPSATVSGIDATLSP
jgi:hypothetical protein